MISQMLVRCWEKVEEIFSLYEQAEVGAKVMQEVQLAISPQLCREAVVPAPD